MAGRGGKSSANEEKPSFPCVPNLRPDPLRLMRSFRATASIGLSRFGTTVHADAVAEHFQLTSEHIARRVVNYVKDLDNKNAWLHPWREI